MKSTSSEIVINQNNIKNIHLHKSISFNTDNSMSGTDRYKRYLIDKLLNESIASTQLIKQQVANTNNDSIILPQTINANNSNNNLNDSREDLTSETGTYVIDENLDRPDSAMQNNNNFDIDLKQSTNTIDLISARAAIDETFGVLKPTNDDQSQSSNNNTPTSTPKRQTQKMIRARNQTYSLSKDLFIGENSSQQQSSSNENTLKPNETDPTQPVSILKKTTTYDVIPNEVNEDAKTDLNESTVSSKVLGTELLLGDTERLMEQIKMKRFEKRQSLKARLISANNNLNQSRSSSSSCSSSNTMLSNQQKDLDDASLLDNNQKSKCWIIPCREDDPTDLNSTTNTNNNNNSNCNDDYFNSTRATINASREEKSISSLIKNQSRTNGGMAFEFFLDDNNNANPVIINNHNNNNNGKNNKNEYIIDDDDESLANSMSRSAASYTSIRRSNLAKSTDSSIFSSSTYATTNDVLTTPKSNLTQMSLGAKIQARAKENAAGVASNTNTSESLDKSSKQQQRQSIKRISSDNTHLQLSNITASTNNAVSSPSQYINRTLMLRQQTAKARRNSDNKSDLLSELSLNRNTSSASQKSSLTMNGVLKKSASNAATSSMTSMRNSTATSLANKSLSNLTNLSLVGTSTNTKKKSSRSNSREAASTSSNHNSSLMTTSLTLPNGSNSMSNHNDHRDSFIRRKAYDPVKAVELEKQKKKEEQIKRKSLLLEQQQQQQQQQHQLKIIEDNDVKISNMNQSIDENTVCDSFNSLPVNGLNSSKQTKSKTLNHSVSFDDQINNTSSNNSSISSSSSNNTNKRSEEESSTYEKILQSTLQRLCIRLIQMSTGVLDKIGDNSAKLNESNSLLNSIGSTELERMQQLAKLVHSMQLVHDHVQIIDSTLFNPKPEEAYMKELSRLRQELASLNTSSLGHHTNNNNHLN